MKDRFYIFKILSLLAFLSQIFSLSTKAADFVSMTSSDSTPQAEFDHSYTKWAQVLEKYVITKGASSSVNYRELKKKEKFFDLCLAEFSKVTESQFNSWGQNQKLAFLINSYNAFTIKHVLNNYPIESVNKIGPLLESPWQIVFFSLLGKNRNLDWLRFKAIRGAFPDPRILFALNSGTVSSPPLKPDPYVAHGIDLQLENQTKLFLRDSTHNRLSKKTKTLYLSKIFSPMPWFGDDFIKEAGSINKFIAPYITDDPSLRKILSKNSFKNEFLKYDWQLNEIK
ncbi:MAG: DUF547 domain-containing protein [Bdellovibrionales bacterium]|nr:DUF547 domain-containing protein [Bdellovibrionales bacterium]